MFSAHLPRGEFHEAAADHFSPGADFRPAEAAKPSLGTGGEANFHAELGGGDVIKAPTDLAPDMDVGAAAVIQPAAFAGGIMEMAAMPVIPAGLQGQSLTGLGGATEAQLAAVIADALPGQPNGMDINSLLDGLPSAGAGGGSMSIVDVSAGHMPMFVIDLASFNVSQVFDVSMAAHDVAMAAGHA